MLKILYRGGRGLYTRIDPARLSFTDEDGVVGLAYAVNVVIDDSLRVSRRKGYSKVDSNAYHSLYSNGDHFLGVTAKHLKMLSPDYSSTDLVTLSNDNRVSYANIGTAVYYVNGIDVGIIMDGAYEAWTKGTYRGPTTSRKFSGPPAGHLIEFYNGRAWIAKENEIWISELYRPDLFDMARRGFQFESRIKMMRGVSGGVFVSTERRTLLLAGNAAEQMEEIRLTDYPAILGTDVRTSGLVFGGERRAPREIIIWTSTEGICVGTPPDGFMFDNVTKDQFDFPSTYEGTACIMDGIYVVNLTGV